MLEELLAIQFLLWNNCRRIRNSSSRHFWEFYLSVLINFWCWFDNYLTVFNHLDDSKTFMVLFPPQFLPPTFWKSTAHKAIKTQYTLKLSIHRCPKMPINHSGYHLAAPWKTAAMPSARCTKTLTITVMALKLASMDTSFTWREMNGTLFRRWMNNLHSFIGLKG